MGEKTGFDDLEVVSVTVEDVTVRVVSPASLYRLKKDTVRPIDKADAQALRAAFAIEDEE